MRCEPKDIERDRDACVYDWSDNGVGDCMGSGDHIGIVTASNGTTFTVTEGNMSGGVVGARNMKVNARYKVSTHKGQAKKQHIIRQLPKKQTFVTK